MGFVLIFLMNKPSSSILIVEQSQAMLDRLTTAFKSAGFIVSKAKNFYAAMLLISESVKTRTPFSLMLLDISGDSYLFFIGNMHQMDFPVLTVRNDADKSLIIEMLNRGSTEFLDHFMETYKAKEFR